MAKIIKAGVWIGVDPGINGALAFYNPVTEAFNVVDTPACEIFRNGKRRRQIDALELAKVLELYTAGQDVHAYVEAVGAMPGQGVTSMFSFGRAVGVIEGELAYMGVDPVYVQPRAWQTRLGIPPRSDKSVHRALAADRFPLAARMFARKKDDGRADAALILNYGLITEGLR